SCSVSFGPHEVAIERQPEQEDLLGLAERLVEAQAAERLADRPAHPLDLERADGAPVGADKRQAALGTGQHEGLATDLQRGLARHAPATALHPSGQRLAACRHQREGGLAQTGLSPLHAIAGLADGEVAAARQMVDLEFAAPLPTAITDQPPAIGTEIQPDD